MKIQWMWYVAQNLLQWWANIDHCVVKLTDQDQVIKNFLKKSMYNYFVEGRPVDFTWPLKY